MITFNNRAAQGDLLIRRINQLPEGLTPVNPVNGKHIVAHSETGHNHVIVADRTEVLTKDKDDGMVMFLVVDNEADLIHERSFDTHETIRIDAGVYEVRRQREYTPEGWRRVED